MMGTNWNHCIYTKLLPERLLKIKESFFNAKTGNKIDAFRCISRPKLFDYKEEFGNYENQLSFLLTFCLSAAAYANKSN